MTERSLLDWLTDYGKAVALSGGIGAVLVIGFYALMRWFPKWWWVLAAVALTGFGIVYALVLPIVIDPIFNTFEPLHDEQLRERIQILADRAGVPIQEVYVMDASRRGKHTNAYFTGFGPTRQIVLYDTLVANHPPEELEIILAHEMGHWMHHHIYIGLALGSLGAFVGFYLLRLILRRAVHQPALQLRSPADPAGLPLIMLLVFLGSWLILPLENGISRHFETQADMASLNLTENPKVFIDTERRLARDNKANVAPSPLSVWVFNTHPPVVERIQLAKDWQKEMR